MAVRSGAPRRVATPDWLGYLFQFQVGPIHSDHPLNQPLYPGMFRFNSTLARFILLAVWHGAVIIGNRFFRSPDDYLTFTEIVASQKSKLPFCLYAYRWGSRSCLAWPRG
jgi:hypothetical protein